MPIRAVRKEDHDAIWQILEPAIMDKAEAIPHWTGPDREAFVAEKDGRIIGTYYLRANQAGGGAHVANCGYMTADDARGRGVARSMCEHSPLHARERGFRAMQFNCVISTNEQAIRWGKPWLHNVCRLPLAFHHPQISYTDALVMFRSL